MNSNQLSFKGLAVWFICVLFFLYEFLLRTILGTFQDAIIDDLGLSSYQFALLSSSAFLFVYGVMQIAISPLLIRFGIKRTLLFAALLCSASTLGFALSNNYPLALLFRALMGCGAAFGFICVLVSIYDWLPYRYIALFIGLSQFIGTMGPMASGGPLNELAQSHIITWQTMFYGLSVLGLLLSALIVLVVDKNRTCDQPFIVLKSTPDLKKELHNLKHNSQVWFILLFCAFIYFSLEYLTENECKNLLMAKGFSATFSAYMLSVSWLGFAIGSPLFGFISDKLSRRKPILLYSATATFLSLGAIIYLPLSEQAAIALFFSYGLAIGASSVGIVIMGEQFRADNVSVGLGINNAATILFVSLMAPCMSLLLDLFSGGHAYSLADFHRAFIVLVILPFIALLLAIFKINETFGKSSKEFIILNYKSVQETPEINDNNK